jgi:hypothetical protein
MALSAVQINHYAYYLVRQWETMNELLLFSGTLPVCDVSGLMCLSESNGKLCSTRIRFIFQILLPLFTQLLSWTPPGIFPSQENGLKSYV